MQTKIAKSLNVILILFSAVVLILFAGIFYVTRQYYEYRLYYIGGFIIISAALTFIFKWLESRWDKTMIARMAKNNKIALFNIQSSKRLLPLRDTSLINYWIYEISGVLYNSEHVPLEKTIQEKMNLGTTEIPGGSVYVTYDEMKPEEIFIIPNIMISSLPNLMPIVQSYEKDRKITIKYLDAHYKRGMVIRTYGEAIADYKAKGRNEVP
jgi:hypothetical protein